MEHRRTRDGRLPPRLGYIAEVDLDDDLQLELDELRQHHRFRDTRPLTGLDRVNPATSDFRPLLSFCSNDYLGLSSHPAVLRAASRAAVEFGFGSGGSRLVSGETPLHRELESALAAFLDRPAALLFPTGYQTNLGVLTTLASKNDLIVSDAANHASIIDGCRLSRARIQVYPHLDVDGATAALDTPGDFRRRILITESLFSMDGDRAPLADLHRVARKRGAILVVDEAHAIGVIGPGGRGLAAQTGVAPDIIIGTLGKAFGALGGFAAGSTSLRAILMNRARSFIYTTGTPAPIAAAAAAALREIAAAGGDILRSRAHALAAQLRARLAARGMTIGGRDLILPLIYGSDQRALDASAGLLARGILVPAIRSPTVPVGTSRLRITVSAGHSPADVDRLALALEELPDPHGLGVSS